MMTPVRSLAVMMVAALPLLSATPATAQTPPPAKPETAPAVTTPAAAPTAAPKPASVPAKRFASAEEAAQALVTAVRAGDVKALVSVLGSEGRSLVSSGDAVSDRQLREKFLLAYDAGSRLIPYGTYSVLEVGADNWAFPIPIVKDGERWRFDVRQGREEIIARRIGHNELYTMQTCLAYVDAQREYYARDPDGDALLQYAQKFASRPGMRDGLYWPTNPGEPPSPLGLFVARARGEGYRKRSANPVAYWGYNYRILTAQGKDAPGGAYDYLAHGKMIGGFALVAYPAQYGASGVMTFIVNQDGVVYQKNLGPNSAGTARAMKSFNPDSTWTKL